MHKKRIWLVLHNCEGVEGFYCLCIIYGFKKVSKCVVLLDIIGTVLYCHVIANYFYETNTMHLVNIFIFTYLVGICEDKALLKCNKMHKVIRLFNDIHAKCKKQWNLEKEIIMIERMIYFEGSYCLA